MTTSNNADAEEKTIGEMNIKMSVDADALHASFDVIEDRIKVLLAKLEELSVAAERVGIKVEAKAFLTQG